MAFKSFRMFTQGNGHYTWWTAWGKKYDHGWRLDYQIATPELAAKASRAAIQREAAFSDHAPVSVDYDTDLNPAG